MLLYDEVGDVYDDEYYENDSYDGFYGIVDYGLEGYDYKSIELEYRYEEDYYV